MKVYVYTDRKGNHSIRKSAAGAGVGAAVENADVWEYDDVDEKLFNALEAAKAAVREAEAALLETLDQSTATCVRDYGSRR